MTLVKPFLGSLPGYIKFFSRRFQETVGPRGSRLQAVNETRSSGRVGAENGGYHDDVLPTCTYRQLHL